MSFKAANKAKTKTHQDKREAEAETAGLPKPILGVDIKGELRDIGVDLINDPAGMPDRLARADDDTALAQLVGSMRECGQLQPIMIEEIENGEFVRVFGRRRLAAARRLGWKTVRAVVVPPLSPDVRRTVVAIENVQRQNLTPAEETLAVAELMELQAFPAAIQLGKPLTTGPVKWHGIAVSPEILREVPIVSEGEWRRGVLMDHRVRGIASELVAAMLGKPASWVRDRMYIGRLSEKARGLVLAEKLPLAHAREISKVADEKLRDRLARDYAAGGDDSIGDTEAGKLEELQEEVRRQVFSLHVVPWNLEVPFAGKVACNGCPHNSSTNPGLFEHGGQASLAMIAGRGTYDSVGAESEKAKADGICTLASCYAEKNRTAKAAISSFAKRIVDADPKGKPKKGAVANAAANISAKVPDYVDRNELARRVEGRRKRKRSAYSSKGVVKDSAAEKSANIKREAESEWRRAMDKRCEAFEAELTKKLLSIPGAWSLFKLFTKTAVYDKTHTQQVKAAARAVANPILAAALKATAKPSFESLTLLEAKISYKGTLLERWNDKDTGILELIAKVYELPLKPAPTVQSFMPKAVAAVAATAPSKATAKPTGKTAKRPKREPDQVESAGDEGGEE